MRRSRHCHTPVGVLADGGVVRAFVGLPDGSAYLLDEAADRRRRSSPASSPPGAADLLREAELAP